MCACCSDGRSRCGTDKGNSRVIVSCTCFIPPQSPKHKDPTVPLHVCSVCVLMQDCVCACVGTNLCVSVCAGRCRGVKLMLDFQFPALNRFSDIHLLDVRRDITLAIICAQNVLFSYSQTSFTRPHSQIHSCKFFLQGLTCFRAIHLIHSGSNFVFLSSCSVLHEEPKG